MSIITPLCLQLTCTASAAAPPVIVDNTNKCYSITVTLPSGGGQSYHTSSGQLQTYTCSNIQVGYWIAGSAAGFAWRIIQIQQLSGPYQVKLLVEDVDNFNYKIDSGTNNFKGKPQLSTLAGSLMCFQLNNDGMPIFSPTYYLFTNTTLPQLPADIMSRFAAQNPSRQYVNVYQIGNGLHIGDPVWINPIGNSGATGPSGQSAYQVSTNTNAPYTVGVVTSTGLLDADSFTYKVFGIYYTNISSFFTGSTGSQIGRAHV